MQVIRGVIFLKEVLLRQPEHKILQNAENILWFTSGLY